jgi:2-octaprenyl-6-methoxyphenol hydroxylase
MKKHFDIVIIGGGAVGCSLALALSKCQFNVALLDEKAPEERCIPEKDNRIFALAAGTHCILDRLGVWQQLADKASPIHHIHASNKGSFGSVRLHASEYQMESLGYMLASTDLQAALNLAVSEESLTQYYPAKFKHLKLGDPANITFDMNDEEHTITANHVVAADGAHSSVRRSLHLTATTRDFAQHALVAKVQLTRDHQATAYERFVDNGAIALLPYGDKQCALIWSLDKQETTDLLKLSDKDFLDHLQTVFGYRLGKLQGISRRMSYPLIETVSDQVLYRNQLIFAGNAAQTLHPIAAQGFNLALRNIALLADMLVKARRGEMSKEEALEQFVSLHHKDQRNTRCFTNALVQFFSDEGLASSGTIRGLALSSIELCPPAKRYLIKGVMKGVERLARAME